MKRALPLLAILALTGCGGAATTAVSTSPSPTFGPLFTQARACILPDTAWEDDNTTLILDGPGKDDRTVKNGTFEYDTSKISDDTRECVFEKLETPQSIQTKMGQTRALDGRQEDTAGGFTYSWTYHPDSGLDVIITDADS